LKTTRTFIVFGLLVSGLANAAEFEPAEFSIGGGSPAKKIVFPEIEQDGAWLLRCESWVDRAGLLQKVLCYDSTKDVELTRRLARAVERISRRVVLSPATVNGEDKWVLMSFSVYFQKRAEEYQIEVYPNHLLDYEKYGRTYSAPQRISEEEGVYPPRIHCKSLVMIVTADIDEAGNAANAEVAQVGGMTRRLPNCEKEIEAFIESALYIPAMYNGEYVVAKHEDMLIF